MPAERHAQRTLPGIFPLVALLCCAAPASAGVTLQLTPASQTVAPGAEFEVKIRVPVAGSAFNAFKAVIAYDPAMLTPVKLSPVSSQIDSLFSFACGNRFHRFGFGFGLDSVDVSLLCNGVSVTGPGALYRLRFRAANTTGRTGLYFRSGLEVANGGILVSDVAVSGATIGIGVPVTDAAPGESGAMLRLSAFPNPAAGECLLDFGRPLELAGRLEVRDVQGRSVLGVNVARGARARSWDGRDDRGDLAPPGVYLAVLRVGEVRSFVRVTRVR